MIVSNRRHLFTINLTFRFASRKFSNAMYEMYAFAEMNSIYSSLSKHFRFNNTEQRRKRNETKNFIFYGAFVVVRGIVCASKIYSNKIVGVKQETKHAKKKMRKNDTHSHIHLRRNYVKYVCSIKYDRTKQ